MKDLKLILNESNLFEFELKSTYDFTLKTYGKKMHFIKLLKKKTLKQLVLC